VLAQALPIAETDVGNLSAYIPTNLISMTPTPMLRRCSVSSR
jgi:F0F1-type ATP synthase alpha subunit